VWSDCSRAYAPSGAFPNTGCSKVVPSAASTAAWNDATAARRRASAAPRSIVRGPGGKTGGAFPPFGNFPVFSKRFRNSPRTIGRNSRGMPGIAATLPGTVKPGQPRADGTFVGPRGAELFAALIVSAFGAGLFIYGKKRHRVPHLLAGLALMGGPYFMSSTAWILVFGAAGLAATWAASRAGM